MRRGGRREDATSGAAAGSVLQLVAEHHGGVVRVELLHVSLAAHLRVGRVLGGEGLLVGNVGVRVDALLLGVVQRVDDHVVVEHLGLVDAVYGVELVLPLGLGVGPSLLDSLPPLAAHQVEDSDHDQHGDHGGAGQDEGPLRLIGVLGFASDLEDGAVGQDVAVFARVSGKTLALKVVQLVNAESVEAGGSGALVDLRGAVLAGVAGLAGADEVVDGVVAGAAVGARIGLAVVDVVLAVSAHESGVAVALVVVDKVEAGAPVLAGVGGAVVHVDLAVLATEALGTLALVGVGSGELAGASVLAGGGAAVVDLDVAVHALELGGALALVSVVGVGADRAVLAGSVGAGLGVHLAVAAVEAQGANAHIIVLAGALKIEREKINAWNKFGSASASSEAINQG